MAHETEQLDGDDDNPAVHSAVVSRVLGLPPPGGGTNRGRRWLDDKQARLASGTAYDWRRIVESRLIPAFGDRQVSGLDVEAIEGFIADLKRGEV